MAVFESLGKSEIAYAIDELVHYIGVKEKTSLQDLLPLVRSDIQRCIEQIASRLGFRIRVELSIVRNYGSGASKRFESTSLVRVHSDGRASEAIAAQVLLPVGLSELGVAGLYAQVFEVRISENCQTRPETFISIMGHELAHILLHALNHPRKESELHTDLVPIILGLGEFVEKGRKTIDSTPDGTTTTTYGYLTDAQYQHASRYVESILSCRTRSKRALAHSVAGLRRSLDTARDELVAFRTYLNHVDSQPPRTTRNADALNLVEFHRPDYTDEWEAGLGSARTVLEQAEGFALSLNHYTDGAMAQLERHEEAVSRAQATANRTSGMIRGDVETLRRYLPFLYREFGLSRLRS